VSLVDYELGFYIPEDVILHSHRRVNLKSYTAVKQVALNLPLFDAGDCNMCYSYNAIDTFI
jgi:hypothetical protein